MVDMIVAGRMRADEGFPDEADWDRAPEVRFSADWRGEAPDPERETRVRMLWSKDDVHIRFHCRYRNLYIYEGPPCRRDGLWLRDVAEVFIQTAADPPRSYREFEIGPGGDWLDLAIAPGEKRHLEWDLRTRVQVRPDSGFWSAEMALPLRCLDTAFDPENAWKINFFRIEGREPDRFYSAWRPTFTPRPNFHVAERFGTLHFQ
jgi:hypothetical protein